jgi:hypothetical protein
LLAARLRSEPETAAASERLGLLDRDHVGPNARQLALEQLAGAGRASDDHALDSGAGEQCESVCGQGPVSNGDERLRQTAGGVPKAFGLAAGEQDRFH